MNDEYDTVEIFIIHHSSFITSLWLNLGVRSGLRRRRLLGLPVYYLLFRRREVRREFEGGAE
jgi:hypothetical protein